MEPKWFEVERIDGDTVGQRWLLVPCMMVVMMIKKIYDDDENRDSGDENDMTFCVVPTNGVRC